MALNSIILIGLLVLDNLGYHTYKKHLSWLLYALTSMHRMQLMVRRFVQLINSLKYFIKYLKIDKTSEKVVEDRQSTIQDFLLQIILYHLLYFDIIRKIYT